MENFGSKRSFRSCFGNINLEPLEQSIRSSNSTKIVVDYTEVYYTELYVVFPKP